jgi:hypothetical protein
MAEYHTHIIQNLLLLPLTPYTNIKTPSSPSLHSYISLDSPPLSFGRLPVVQLHHHLQVLKCHADEDPVSSSSYSISGPRLESKGLWGRNEGVSWELEKS